ncbi:methyl-accepting chemotaxis protein [Tateyamaria sp. SN6-1]|uniref:methyl-accepting chemotaxis protein n=1 Tax=Tateyamaria sp. SN6-1 TaxID=3092148 RepID=UPI0039F4C4DA
MNVALHHPAPSFADKSDTSHFAHRRAAIDMIATLRARMIRCALFGTYLLRPHPITPESDEIRAQWREKFEEQFDGIKRSYSLMQGKDPLNVLPQDICDWIAAHTAQQTAQMNVLNHMFKLTQDLHDALTGSDQALDEVMKAHFAFGRGQFYDAVTEICDGLWADLDRQRDEDTRHAHDSGKAIGDILGRLERIGKHVRLVSLNASVEAARVGEAGKGLGVIAVEFKSLAEEIQHLAATARENIDGLSSSSR